MSVRQTPVRIALVDDDVVVVAGLAPLFDADTDRIVVGELDANRPVSDDVDVVFYGSFAQPQVDCADIDVLIDIPHARHVAVYTGHFHPTLVDHAVAKGVHGYLSKTLPARELVSAIESIANGDIVVSEAAPQPRPATGLDWPGRSEGLTDREAEVIALITQGRSDAEIEETHREWLDSHPAGDVHRATP